MSFSAEAGFQKKVGRQPASVRQVHVLTLFFRCFSASTLLHVLTKSQSLRGVNPATQA